MGTLPELFSGSPVKLEGATGDRHITPNPSKGNLVEGKGNQDGKPEKTLSINGVQDESTS